MDGDELMSELILTTECLNKEYGRFKALNNINIRIEKGSIYGLIGENGAGKTTLLKIIAGLSIKSSGKLSIMGNDKEQDIRLARQKIGCIIESPALYSNMSVEDNLKIQQLQRNGFIDKIQISRTLELIGLGDQRKKYVWSLSYGMKQRLAIGLALIHNPVFLILDEPINGLDPLGIKDLRNLLKNINAVYGTTILISSHILSELEHIITDYGILHKGSLIEQGNINDLCYKKHQYIRIVTSNISELENILILSNKNYSKNNNEFNVYNKSEQIPHLCKQLVNENIEIEEIRAVFESLEDYFMRIIRERSND